MSMRVLGPRNRDQQHLRATFELALLVNIEKRSHTWVFWSFSKFLLINEHRRWTEVMRV
jgi:hypothetical protein